MGRTVRTLLVLATLAGGRVDAQTKTAFASLVERLSEPGGYFPSDNLVSNETSYLHVLGAMRRLGVRGGAYLGVGPEQGFSYIAAIEPKIALIIDIRRDNLLFHLLLKAVFATARNRLEYLCLLYGRPLPTDLPMWTDLPLESLLDYLDGRLTDSTLHDRQHRRLMGMVDGFGVPLTELDRTTLRRFHDEFAQSGLDIRYSTRGRGPRLMFPTNRRLYLETDLDGGEVSYLSTEDRWRVVRDLERADRIVPVVGDLAGPSAVRAIGDYLREQGLVVSAFYLSNVESYLFRGGTFPAFVENVRALPSGAKSVLIRSGFGRWGGAQINIAPGHFSAQALQTFPRFLEFAADPSTVEYWSLVNDGLELPAAATALPPPSGAPLLGTR
ncbi:MAG: hypothetical protein ACKVZ0_18640 [Gemmatimonadales bacterium]